MATATILVEQPELMNVLKSLRNVSLSESVLSFVSANLSLQDPGTTLKLLPPCRAASWGVAFRMRPLDGRSESVP